MFEIGHRGKVTKQLQIDVDAFKSFVNYNELVVGNTDALNIPLKRCHYRESSISSPTGSTIGFDFCVSQLAAKAFLCCIGNKSKLKDYFILLSTLFLSTAKYPDPRVTN